ncbi:DUF1349 domain-containing protein [Demequina salsinemoris]|uniref:DUF1349 domain-containing protein n=1 Tax=Demequina salsinemoris TaxID=577470 RepID=UPI000783ABB9|nr:DUF1349 domain-containing protein [Demequina salsinemoris]
MKLGNLLELGAWTTPPAAVDLDGGTMVVSARHGSDAWRTTSYGFVHDDAHALLVPMEARQAAEVTFVLDYAEQFDQAGIMVRADSRSWIKCGVEVSDGVPQVGAVVTRGVSDWSVAPVPEWVGRSVTIRASRDGDAVTVRARADSEAWRLVRVAPLAPELEVGVGPYCCAPSRDGLRVTFTDFTLGEPDAALH